MTLTFDFSRTAINGKGEKSRQSRLKYYSEKRLTISVCDKCLVELCKKLIFQSVNTIIDLIIILNY